MPKNQPILSNDRLNVIHRSSLRGLKQCPHCGHYSGCRAVKCKNKQCRRIISAASTLPTTETTSTTTTTTTTNTVQLVSKCDIQLYSVECNENAPPNHQSFVQITDKTISSDDDSCIISRNAICCVKNCKEDALGANMSCVHVRSALQGSCYNGTSVVLPMATALPIDINIWFGMLLGEDWKRRLWTEYCFLEYRIPMVQRISHGTFVIKCEQTVQFPAGRLHLTLTTSVDGQATYSCACQWTANACDVGCDHLFLLLGALLSSDELKLEFRHHIKLMQDTINDVNPVTEDFIKFSETIMSDCVEMTSATLSSPMKLEQFANESLVGETIPLFGGGNSGGGTFTNDTTNDSLKEDQAYILHTTLDSIPILDESLTDDLHTLQLIDCQIELMDQFKLTDHIDMTCTSHEFHLNDNPLDIQNICDLTADIPSTAAAVDAATVASEQFPPTISEASVENSVESLSSVSSTSSKRKLSTTIKPICKQSRSSRSNHFDLDDVIASTVLFDNWMGSVIERVNRTMDFNENGHPEKLLFSVSHGFFNNFRNRFSSGTKRRLPSTTIVIEDESAPYRGLTQYSWMFTSLNAVRQIFCSRNIQLEYERSFVKSANGSYTFMQNDISNNTFEPNQQRRKIRPTKYSTYLRLFTSPKSVVAGQDHMDDVFIIDWIPNVLPQSQYGEMRLHFKFGHKKNNHIID